MSKWYEVVVITSTVYAVEVEDTETKEQAEGYALENLPSGFNGDSEVARSYELVTEEDIDSSLRHCDEKLDL